MVLAITASAAVAQTKPAVRILGGSLRESSIFVPEPKRETLDETTEEAGEAKTDVVITHQGDRIKGKVIDIDADGRLRLSGPQFDGEVCVLAASLDRVVLLCKDKGTGRDVALLTNGDRIVGEITAITPEAVIIESSATGAMKVSRRMVRSVTFSKGKAALLDSSFDMGELSPWKIARGNWSVSDGQLVCNSTGSYESVYAAVEQDEPITVEVKVESLSGNSLNCDLVLFADNPQNNYGGNSVYAMFQGSYYYLYYGRNGGNYHVTSRQIGQTMQSGLLGLSYDPKTGKVNIWLNSNQLGEYVMPNRPQKGQYVMFTSRQPCKVSYIRVLRGVVSPSEQAGGKAEDDRDVVEFANEDRVSTTSVSLADGVFAGEAAIGPLRCEVQNVRRILFRTKGQEKPRMRKGDALVRAGESRLTLQFEKLTDEYLIGNSDYLGQVKVLRGAVREIRFNLYR